MPRVALLGLILFAPVLALPAQECRVRIVEPRFAAAELGTLAWFQHGFELVEANLDCDLAAARKLCERLVEVAATANVQGAKAVAAAVTGLVVSMQDGPARAAAAFEQAGPLPTGVDAALRVHYHLARVRFECARGAHDAETTDWMAAKAAADATDRVLLHLRVFAKGGHHLPQRSVARLQQFFREAEAAGQALEVQHLKYLVGIEEFNLADAENRPSDMARIREEVAKTAAADGNVRVHAVAKVRRAGQWYSEGKRDLAIPLYEEIERDYVRLGDRRELFGVRNMFAWVAMHERDFAKAEKLIAGVQDLGADSGFEGIERELLRLRLSLAVHQEKGELASELRRELDAVESTEAAVVRRTLELREKLVAAEREKEATAERFAAEQELAAERLAEARTIGGAVVLVALTLLVGLSWRSRRRLLVANERLAEQIRAVEAAKAAQLQLEERMRELQRVESLGTMAAGIAHDFNNLLTSIVGSAELLQCEHGERDREELASTIHAAGDQAARLCRQLQAYAGGTPTERIPLDLLAIAREMLPTLQAATKGKVQVSLESEQGAVGSLGDRAQLEQVLLNLVVNARDANARTVRIAIDARPEVVGTNGEIVEPAVARLQVTDDGDGMSDEVQQRIFDPFFTTRFPGRGLGLAVVHGVVRLHSGRITVTSAPGKGSTFAITLPAAATPEPIVEVPRANASKGASAESQTIYVCDDDEAVRTMLVRMLTTMGITARVFGDGASLLREIEQRPSKEPVAAFVDLSMPEMDGVEVVRRLRAMRGDARVVLMSGHPLAYVEQVAGDLGLDGVLTKPFVTDAVRGLVARVVGSGVTTGV